MKKTLFAILFVALITLSVNAATVEYYAGGFFSQSGVAYTNADGNDVSQVDPEGGSEYAYSNADIADSNAQLNTYSEASFENSEMGKAVFLSAHSSVDENSPNAVSLSCYAGSATAVAGLTNGIYFKIVADQGEAIGDDVQVSYEWMCQAYLDAGQANFDGPFGTYDMYVTVGLEPDFSGVPDSQYIAWHKQAFSLYSDDEMSEAGTFSAKVGDTIGVFMSIGVNVDSSSDITSSDEAYMSFDFTAVQVTPATVYTPADADINGDGIVDLGDFAIMASFWLMPAETSGDNDECSGAIPLTLGVEVAGDNTTATGGGIEDCYGEGSDVKDLWYSYTNTTDQPQNVIIMVETISVANTLDSIITLHQNCGGEVEGCANNFGPYAMEEIFWTLFPGETAYIRVAGNAESDPEGQFNIKVEQDLGIAS